MLLSRFPTFLWLVVSLVAVSSFVDAQGSPSTSGGGKLSLAALWKKITQRHPQKAAPELPSSLDHLEEYITEHERPRIRELWNNGVAAQYIHPISGTPLRVDGKRAAHEQDFIVQLDEILAPYIEKAAHHLKG